MKYERVGISVVSALVLLVVVLTITAVWLFVTSPVTVATAVSDGTITPLLRQLADLLLALLDGVLQYL